MRLLKLQKQGTTTFLPNCVFHLAQMRADLYSKGSGLGIINIRYRDKLGTASYQLSSSKLVLNGDCGVRKTEAAKL